MQLGCDPEMFLTTTDGRLISAIGKIGGSKIKPLKIRQLGNGFAIQEDNVLLEYNIPPANSVGQWVGNNFQMQEFLESHLSSKGMKYKISASELMPEEELADPRAFVFGCDPDFNAWTLKINPKPMAADPRLRSAGGHVHVGLELNKVQKIWMVRWMDVFLGLWSVIKDTDNRRRELYGQAGSFRWKNYGFEYRTLSNFWISSEEFMRYVFEQTNRACKYTMQDHNFSEEYGEAVQRAINTGNKQMATELLAKYD